MLKLITDAASEPLTLADAKVHLRVDTTADDAFITSLITVARKKAEAITQRCFITQTWELWLNGFPLMKGQHDQWWDGTREGWIGDIYPVARHIELEKAPIQSVTFLNTYALDDTQTTFSSSNYYVDTVSSPGRVCLNYGAIWPVNLRRHNAIQCQFVAGYGSSAGSVPGDIIHALKILVAHFYEHRGDASEAEENRHTTSVIPTTARQLLDPYTIKRLL